MTCYYPMKAWRITEGPRTGQMSFRGPTFLKQGHHTIPCGQCIGCRLDRSRQWAIRCVHESQTHEENCFITLTFSPAALKLRANPHTIDVRDWQLFIKRLRKKYGYNKKRHPDRPRIRFFHCGEYGENTGRPHYHACLFNFDFPDKRLWKQVNGQNLYSSVILEEIWGHGFCTVGSLTFESAAYVARYCLKKITGKLADEHYQRVDCETGEITVLKPEYTTMSRGGRYDPLGGIGASWLKKYQSDVYPNDTLIMNGKILKPPRYYDNQYKKIEPDSLTAIIKKRVQKAQKHIEHQTPERLAVREYVQLKKLQQLPRNHDKKAKS